MPYTRKDYLSRSIDHNTYYGQFVTPAIINIVKRAIGEGSIRASMDEHFNDIALSQWDRLHGSIQSQFSKLTRAETGLGNSLCESVCIAKQAARMIKNNTK